MSLTFEIPMRTTGGGNARGKWQVDHARAKREIKAVQLRCGAYFAGSTIGGVLQAMVAKGPLDVILTRVSPGKPDPQNVYGMLKHVIDGLAKVFGVNDGDPRIRYICRPEKGPPRQHFIRVEVRGRVELPGWTAEQWRDVAMACRVRAYARTDRPELADLATEVEAVAEAMERA